ncbi:hypothetical protein ACPW7J_03925 [Ihubacter sp. rT4E-8]|uniref:Major facilitator superfamily (MFS) profile domain-containing protein n=1 Tax=Anaerotruncus colihominis TaxID=169435 RepID=A0A845QN54_9FIRM|nr:MULTISPECIES: MFS transporter [Anaerotruncus]NBH62834.1 hypothetical protein [Anaerotruncus colihominis]NCF03488.1 hypothetical protein [Anaerotruncus sp. 80]
MGVTDGRVGSILPFFGLTAVPGYLLGGWLADKFNPKKLVFVSTILTGGRGIVLSRSHSYGMLAAIYAMFGVTKTCMHWGRF